MNVVIAPHSPQKNKHMSWQVCTKCGLVYLNNDITRAAIKYGCEHEDHPEFQRIDKRLRNETKDY